ncbi:unnamed protein product [Prunus armeniaca]|uniref:Uncharacterized protein n=1 Tax=Prunus armeniaca TaxID=36596 RepID=A0A6J5WJ70_PRUAR|nr:unnamed protein product [Prunus armeniaca]CAB4301740.1 unnamed protein product [Prunus armeniaca]
MRSASRHNIPHGRTRGIVLQVPDPRSSRTAFISTFLSVLFSAPRSWVARVSIKGCWRRLSSITNNRYDKLRLLAFVLIWKENSNLGSSFSHFCA